ncbi:hypothetical protein [Thalassobacillus devorans]|uniref:hypothetical protein n=1 Tax=Thalassobacillus devorans TaxID=279813 RepID=UPI000A1CB2C5|nr:hypothetical protein [Thalassobacillus devorans]
MCISTNFIEQEQDKYRLEIQKKSLYKLAHSYSDIPGQTDEKWTNKIILEDENGNLYPVALNPNGLSFATKVITYSEYETLESKENKRAFVTFFGFLGFLITVMVTFAWYFT